MSADLAMIEVPREAFALLMAYCHIGQLDVPSHIWNHPDFPAHRDGRMGHLMKVLRPYVDQAFTALPSPPVKT